MIAIVKPLPERLTDCDRLRLEAKLEKNFILRGLDTLRREQQASLEMANSTTSVQENFRYQQEDEEEEDDEAQSRLLTGNETTRRRGEEKQGVRSVEVEINIARRRGRRKVESDRMREEQISTTTTTSITTAKASMTSKFRTFKIITNKVLLILIMLAQIFVAYSASEKSSETVKGE